MAGRSLLDSPATGQDKRLPLNGILDRANLAGREAGSAHAEVVEFLSQPGAYPGHPADVQIIESHMSLVFLADDLVYKLKRPIKLDFVDFTAIESRRVSCEREFEINQQLAPGVYLRTLPIVRNSAGSLTLGGEGEVIDWLVVMRRLDSAQALDAQIERGEVRPPDIKQVCEVLARFYLGQTSLDVDPDVMLGRWEEGVRLIENALTDPAFSLPSELIDPPLVSLRRFLANESDLLAARVELGRILEGHGDLKPEHIHLGPPILLIDRLEFDERLRWCDPFDEVTFLGIECARLGAPWIAPQLESGMARLLGERPPEVLLEFYRCYRACLRARLSIEHLRDESPRTPSRWPRQARAYLRLAGESLKNGDQTNGNSSLTGSP
ncbi:hypothetical protein [Altererythrobacter sp. ZODW24]|uniref:hypothetical protein n=1 Tax=Altererythrobacter sp. ZODW24 TaxID=2185142 RepID=UPI000DF7F454|nr:hypothetical protein [Altererythrobacter sp. ZODW24]